MKKQRKHYTAEEKVAILRRHLLEQEAVSKLCDELGLQPTVFYRWQKEFFENGAAAFQAKARSDHQAEQERIEFLQKKIQRKDEVLAEFLFPQNNLMAVKPDYPCELMTRVNAEIGLPAEIASLIAEMLSSVPERRPQWKHIESTLRAVHACPRLRDLPKMPARLQVVTPELDSSLLDGLYRFIMATSDCSRSDRLFPADPKVFTTNSLSLAYGAAGVLSAVNYSGYAVPSSAVEWLLSRLKEQVTPLSPGLLIGRAGVAWALLQLGISDPALELFEELARSATTTPFASHDLFSGAAGIGMAMLKAYLLTGDEAFITSAEHIGEHLLRTASKTDGLYFWRKGKDVPIGLAHGSSGVALFLLYLAVVTREDKFLEAGSYALRFDLKQGTQNLDGGLSWHSTTAKTSPLYPYWRNGSAGIGIVALRYGSVLGFDRYDDMIESIFLDTDRVFTVFAGRFHGLSGIGEFLLDAYAFKREDRFLQAARRAGNHMRLFTIERPEGVGLAGDGLLRLSCDFGTGSAGVLAFLSRLYRFPKRQPTQMLLLDELLMDPTDKIPTNDLLRQAHDKPVLQ